MINKYDKDKNNETVTIWYSRYLHVYRKLISIKWDSVQTCAYSKTLQME